MKQSDYAYAPSHKPYYKYSFGVNEIGTEKVYKNYDKFKHYESLVKEGRKIQEKDEKSLIDFINKKA